MSSLICKSSGPLRSSCGRTTLHKLKSQIYCYPSSSSSSCTPFPTVNRSSNRPLSYARTSGALQRTNHESEMSAQSVSNHTEVSLAMARHVFSSNKESNVVFSPLSLNLLVSLIAAGASGPSLKQLLSFLKSDSVDQVNKISSRILSDVFADGSPSGGPNISLANGLWIQEQLPLKHSFRRVLDDVYKASSYQVDFKNTEGDKIVSEVNSWAEEKTNGLIKNVLPPGAVNSLTRLILANALYFKGRWLEEYFKASRTKEDDFHLLDGDSVKAPFMTSGWKHRIGTYDGFKVLCLPYQRGKHDKGRFSMCIFLPDAKDELHVLAEKVFSEPGFIDRHFPCEEVEVDKFMLPKFKISFGFKASKTLKQLGLSLSFEAEAGGLTEMVDLTEEGEESLYVSEIHHKGCIEVNEQGTEAAAVSVALLALGCARRLTPPPKVDFVADHPFMFLIREDNSGAVLFVGHVLNPLEK